MLVPPNNLIQTNKDSSLAQNMRVFDRDTSFFRMNLSVRSCEYLNDTKLNVGYLSSRFEYILPRFAYELVPTLLSLVPSRTRQAQSIPIITFSTFAHPSRSPSIVPCYNFDLKHSNIDLNGY